MVTESKPPFVELPERRSVPFSFPEGVGSPGRRCKLVHPVDLLMIEGRRLGGRTREPRPLFPDSTPVHPGGLQPLLRRDLSSSPLSWVTLNPWCLFSSVLDARSVLRSEFLDPSKKVEGYKGSQRVGTERCPGGSPTVVLRTLLFPIHEQTTTFLSFRPSLRKGKRVVWEVPRVPTSTHSI